MTDRILWSFVQALDDLFEVPCAEDAVRCYGLRFDGFESAHWRRLREALSGDCGRATEPLSLPVSPAEIDRARRYVHAVDAVRHLAGRILLRRASRHAEGRNAWPSEGIADWPCDALGKPRATPSGWEVSITHSGPEVWVAMARGAAVGIDVEIEVPEWEAFCGLLHPQERLALSAMQGASPEFDSACRRVWVRKEAAVKAIGLGLSMPLDGFEVAVDAAPADWMRQPPDGRADAWTAQDRPSDLADEGEALAGAVAVAAQGSSVVWRLGRVPPP